MARYLVTGGAGFIGRRLCARLLEAGHEVRVIDCLVEQVHGQTGPTAPADLEFLCCDLRDNATVATALRGVDGVFHLAAEVGVGQSMYEIARYVGANDLGTAVLLEEVSRSSVGRVVVASSMSVYGEGLYATCDGASVEDAARRPEHLREGRWDPVGPDGRTLIPIPTPETKRPDLSSVYALTKYVQERLTLTLTAAYGIEGVALRLFNVFGPGQALANPYTGVMAIFAGRLLAGEAPLLYEDGRQLRDFVHVDDVADAFVRAMQSADAPGEVINIGSGSARTVHELADRVCEAMGREDLAPRVLGRARAGDIRHCVGDVTKARRLLGHVPQRTLDGSIEELVDWVSRQRAPRGVEAAQSELLRRGLVV